MRDTRQIHRDTMRAADHARDTLGRLARALRIADDALPHSAANLVAAYHSARASAATLRNWADSIEANARAILADPPRPDVEQPAPNARALILWESLDGSWELHAASCAWPENNGLVRRCEGGTDPQAIMARWFDAELLGLGYSMADVSFPECSGVKRRDLTDPAELVRCDGCDRPWSVAYADGCSHDGGCIKTARKEA